MTERRQTNRACRLELTSQVPDNTVVEIFDGFLDGVNTDLVIYTHGASVYTDVYTASFTLTKPELRNKFSTFDVAFSQHKKEQRTIASL